MKEFSVQKNSGTKNVSRKLAEYVALTNFDSLPEQVIHQFRRSLLDFLCVSIVGSCTPVSEKVLDYFRTIDNSEKCTVIGSRGRLSAPNAAFVNGTSAHALDFDDGHTASSIHQGSMVFPAVLASFEEHRPDIDRVILGAMLGQEIAIRIGMGGHPATWRRGFHNTGIVGPFGAAAGVSKILGLSVEATLDALGLAGSHAGGLFEFLASGADTKRIHPGKASRDGLICAELAARGVTGPPTVLEGPMGYFKAYAGEEIKLDKIMDGLGEKWEVLNAYTKPYPCCRHLHAPIDIALALKQEESLKHEEVDKINISTYATASRHNAQVAETVLEAQMSIPCAVALALKYGEVTVEQFSSKVFLAPDIVNLMKQVSIQVDDISDKQFPLKRITTFKVRTKGGKEFQKSIDNPKGSEDWPLSDQELGAKFTQTCGPILGQKRSDKIVDMVLSLNNTEKLVEILGLCTQREEESE
jgi:2-methylcitrate dehydratase PrpD